MNHIDFFKGETAFVTFLASFLIWFMFAGVFYLWMVNKRFKKREVLKVLLTSSIAFGLSQVIKAVIPIERPFEVNGKPPLTLTVPFDNSFPSGHSSVAFALASGVWFRDKKTGKFFVFSAILVALGRILGNVHYISDVIAGCLLGSATGLVLEKSSLEKLLKG
jgi:undecaprenyl-diphosphatase